jgi:hypothetical protein
VEEAEAARGRREEAARDDAARKQEQALRMLLAHTHAHRLSGTGVGSQARGLGLRHGGWVSGTGVGSQARGLGV